MKGVFWNKKKNPNRRNPLKSSSSSSSSSSIYIYIYIYPTDMIQSIKFFLIKNLKTKKQKMNTTSPSNCIVVCFDSLLIVDE